MMLKKWEEVPAFMQTSDVYKYYQILEKKRITLCLKRVFDIVLSFVLLILLSPIMGIVAIWIKLDSKGSILYKQERITSYGQVFYMMKFRTMVPNADKMGSLITLAEDSRITKVGKKIRDFRIDELPQLMNVFLGDMSFVGTRPEVVKYVSQYTNEMNSTLLLPAGITSIASITYRNEDLLLDEMIKKGMTVDEAYLTQILPEKMVYNLKYLSSMTLIDDVKICMKTLC